MPKKTDSNYQKKSDSNYQKKTDSYLPKKTDSYLPKKTDSYLTKKTDSNYQNPLSISPVSTGKTPFTLIDTPGIYSKDPSLKNSFLLKQSLSLKPINTIFIVLKFDNRFVRIEDELFEVSDIVENYEKKFVLIISHMDLSQNLEQDQRGIRKMFCDFPNIIFVGKKQLERDFCSLADQMFGFMDKMKPEFLVFQEENCFDNYDIFKLKKIHEKEFVDFDNEVKALKNAFYIKLKEIDNENKLEDGILHSMIVHFKYIMDDLNQKYLGKSKTKMEELNYYGFAIKIQKETMKHCDEFNKKFGEYMSFSLNDFKEPRNLIKRCPNCKIVWYKELGCDATIIYGSIENEESDNFEKESQIFKYSFEWINLELKMNKKTNDFVKNKLSKNKKKKNLFPFFSFCGTRKKIQKYKNKKSQLPLESGIAKTKMKKRIGCGKKFNWRFLPCLGENDLLTFFNVKTLIEIRDIVSNEISSSKLSYKMNNRNFLEKNEEFK